jgi:hypothetical protein
MARPKGTHLTILQIKFLSRTRVKYFQAHPEARTNLANKVRESWKLRRASKALVQGAVTSSTVGMVPR